LIERLPSLPRQAHGLAHELMGASKRDAAGDEVIGQICGIKSAVSAISALSDGRSSCNAAWEEGSRSGVVGLQDRDLVFLRSRS
jgi:hypothetical protein